MSVCLGIRDLSLLGHASKIHAEKQQSFSCGLVTHRCVFNSLLPERSGSFFYKALKDETAV